MYLFLFAGLLAMSAARISVISYLRGGQRIPFDKRRMAGMVLIILAMVGINCLCSCTWRVRREAISWRRLVTWIIYGLVLSPQPGDVIGDASSDSHWGGLLNVGAIIQALVELVNRLQRMIDALTSNIEK